MLIFYKRNKKEMFYESQGLINVMQSSVDNVNVSRDVELYVTMAFYQQW